MTNYYIKRIQSGKEMYFARHLWKNQNHWVLDKREAKYYTMIQYAKQVIRQYDLKNCDVVGGSKYE